MSDMNNFFLNQDPLLPPQPPVQQMNPMMYQQMQMTIKDSIGELDNILKNLSPAVLDKISSDAKFTSLNTEFQTAIQQELLSLVKTKLNVNPEIINNIKEQIKIIDDAKKCVESEKEESLNEMNDYIKNYSNLTFDDYKRMKNGEPIEKKKKSIL